MKQHSDKQLEDLKEQAESLYGAFLTLNSREEVRQFLLDLCTPAELEAIGQYLKSKPWWIIADEIYEYMAFEDRHHSIGALVPELMDRYVVVNGLSKGFAMTGWRVGYMAGPTKLARLVKTLQTQSSTCLPPFIEAAAIEALKRGQGLMADKMASLKGRRDLAGSGDAIFAIVIIGIV